MKGIVFTSDSIESVHRGMSDGRFGVRIRSTPAIFFPTVADFAAVEAGDLVFFFARRFFFGVGRVVGEESKCAGILNYPSALRWPLPERVPAGESCLVEGTAKAKMRIVVGIEPVGEWYEDGVDIDDVLSAPGSEWAASLRLMAGKSFHFLAHEEATWLAQLLHRRLGLNSERLPVQTGDVKRFHRAIRNGGAEHLSIQDFVASRPASFLDTHDLFRRESLLHAALIERLRRDRHGSPLGPPKRSVVYLNSFHEYWASPAKQAGDADRLDVLATYHPSVKGDDFKRSAPVALHVCEAKAKYRPTKQEPAKLVAQGLKYVDFLARRVTAGDYAPITLSLLLGRPSPRARSAFEYRTALIAELTANGLRRYTIGARQAGNANRTWNAVQLLEYHWSREDGELVVAKVWPDT